MCLKCSNLRQRIFDSTESVLTTESLRLTTQSKRGEFLTTTEFQYVAGPHHLKAPRQQILKKQHKFITRLSSLNGYLSDYQHGFIKGRSCTTQQLAVDEYTEILDQGGAINAVSFGSSKALSTTPHQSLTVKLEG